MAGAHNKADLHLSQVFTGELILSVLPVLPLSCQDPEHYVQCWIHCTQCHFFLHLGLDTVFLTRALCSADILQAERSSALLGISFRLRREERGKEEERSHLVSCHLLLNKSIRTHRKTSWL